jgi:hypothetical protein
MIRMTSPTSTTRMTPQTSPRSSGPSWPRLRVPAAIELGSSSWPRSDKLTAR